MSKLDNATFLTGDATNRLRELPAESVHTAITSPPYFGLRDYHAEGQIGLEDSLNAYIDNLCDVLDEVKRVLHPTGTLWLNLGDSYAGSGGPGGDFRDGKGGDTYKRQYDRNPSGLKKKDLCMVPARVAMELQSRGWWLRSEIIWAKSISFNEKYSGSCMPESASDRPTNGHEKIYLLSKSKDYFYDEQAVAEPITDPSRIGEVRGQYEHSARDEEKVNQIGPAQGVMKPTKKLRDVWTFNPAMFAEEHFATYPLELIEPCVKAGTSAHGVCSNCGAPHKRETESEVELRSGSGKAGREPEGKYEGRQETTSGTYDVRMGGTPKTKTVGWRQACDCDAEVKPATVLDPFSGAATTGIAALKHGRKYIGVDVNEDYNELAKERIREHKDVPANHNFW